MTDAAAESFRGLPAIDTDAYHGPSWWPLSQARDAWRHPASAASRPPGSLINVVSVVTGILNVEWGWNAIPVAIGPLRIELTFYPPLVLSLLCAVWLGPSWGIVPAYLANLASALSSGIAWPLAALFSLAGAIEIAIFWGSMVTLNVSPDLRRVRDLLRFAAVALVAPTTSSLAVIIWNTAHGLDFRRGPEHLARLGTRRFRPGPPDRGTRAALVGTAGQEPRRSAVQELAAPEPHLHASGVLVLHGVCPHGHPRVRRASRCSKARSTSTLTPGP